MVQGEQRNKWQGPAAGGKDAVYAGWELEPTQWSALGRVWFPIRGCLRLAPCFCFRWSAVQFFWLSRLLSERELCVVLGLSFYPLEQAPNIMTYAMSKSGTATSGLIYVAGLFTQAHGQTRAVAAKKFICR